MKSDRVNASLRMLREPGLPPLFQTHVGWSTALELPRLSKLAAGLADRVPYTGDSLGDGVTEEGEVLVELVTPGGWPTEMQLLNCRYLTAMDAELADAVAHALAVQVPALRAAYDFRDDLDDVLPRNLRCDVIPQLLRLNTILIQPTKSATPYLGFDFACAWDEEHGFGMMLYGTEPILTGGSDVAVTTSIADNHAAGLRGA